MQVLVKLSRMFALLSMRLSLLSSSVNAWICRKRGHKMGDWRATNNWGDFVGAPERFRICLRCRTVEMEFAPPTHVNCRCTTQLGNPDEAAVSFEKEQA